MDNFQLCLVGGCALIPHLLFSLGAFHRNLLCHQTVFIPCFYVLSVLNTGFVLLVEDLEKPLNLIFLLQGCLRSP